MGKHNSDYTLLQRDDILTYFVGRSLALPQTACSVRVFEAVEQLEVDSPPYSPSLPAVEPTSVVVHLQPLDVAHYSTSAIVFFKNKISWALLDLSTIEKRAEAKRVMLFSEMIY